MALALGRANYLYTLYVNKSYGRSGRLVRVDEMSDGTRDQLYLALRLAHLEHYLDEGKEPLPFVIDDVLVNFDDRRCGAAIQALHRLAARVQVIVFTHHRHVVELAREALPGARAEGDGGMEVVSFGGGKL